MGDGSAATPMGALALVLLLLQFATDVALAPALVPLAQQRRHFPLFVGTVQLVSLLLYDACLVSGTDRIFIRSVEWHFISDVLSLTYALLVIVHLAAEENEEIAMTLRYLAFFSSWITKYRDAWNSVVFEVALTVAYLAYAAWSHVAHPRRRGQFRSNHVHRAAGSGAFGFVLFAAAQLTSRYGSVGLRRVMPPFLLCLAHIVLGFASFEAWLSLPSPAHRAKKLDAAGAHMPTAAFV